MVKDAMKREESYVRVNKWQGGKISALVHPPSESTALGFDLDHAAPFF